MSACRSCGASVVWVKIRPGGRAMPLDADPHPDGNVIVDLNAGAGVVLSTATLDIVREDTPDEPLYRSHFATCPHAKDWRQ